MAGRGGKRPGAGRKAGERNKKTEAVIKGAEAAGVTPLEYLLGVMRDDKGDPSTRLDAAKAAAPYMHPRLASVVHTGKDGGPIATFDLSKLTDAQLAQAEPLLAMLAAAGAPSGASTH